MERQVVLYIAISMDGFIATPDDQLSWLTQVEGEGDNGYQAFYDTVDTIIMGNRTYAWILREEGEHAFPYKGKTCYVYTRAEQVSNNLVRFTHEPVEQLVARLRQESGRSIWLVGGGKLARAFMEKNLVDEWVITIAPVLLGKGIPLFHAQESTTMLTLTDVRRYGQFMQGTYRRRIEP